MSALTYFLKVVGYDDVPPTNNPVSTGINYGVQIGNVPCDNPERQAFDIAPGDTVIVVDGTRTTSINGSTAFDLALSSVDSTVYRATWTGAGAAPAFRTARAVDLTAITLTLSLSANLSMSVVAGSGTPFSAVVAGDTVFIPGITTGDPVSPFNSLNEGYWTVLAATSTTLTLARDPSVVFSGISEVVVAPAADEFLAFTSSGVQIGDTVDISAGFAPAARRSFDVVAVTPAWIEFRSTGPLADEEDVVPGAAGFIVYTDCKRFVGIVTDQEIVVRYNGDVGNTNRVEPLLAGTQGFEGSDHKFGSVWQLEIYNRSSVVARVKVASAE